MPGSDQTLDMNIKAMDWYASRGKAVEVSF
jgi:hypothetical protein